MTLHRNRPDVALLGDITKISADEVRRMARIPQGREIDVMFGGPPCQAFQQQARAVHSRIPAAMYFSDTWTWPPN